MKRKHHILSGLPVLLLALVMIVSMSSFTLAASKPGTPKIKTLTSNDAGSLVIKVRAVKSAKGYQVKYSRNKDFSSGATKSFTGSQKTIMGLKQGKTYYIKVRAYTTNSSGKKVYSSYSAAKSIKVAAYATGYTKNYTLRVNTKKSKSSSTITIPYKSRVLVSKSIEPRKKSQWIKLKYNGSIYYIYAKANTRYFTSTGLNHSKYENLCTSEIRRRVVSDALDIWANEKTYYGNTKNIAPGKRDSAGRMRFDCSGFTSYIINGVMQDYIPNFNLSNGIDAQKTGGLLYTDKNGGFKVKTVCTGKPDFSKIKPGDLVFFDDNDSVRGDCDHVGIYIGNKHFIHCTKSINCVGVMTMGSGRYYKRFLYAKSFVPNSNPVPMNKTMYAVSPWTTGIKVYKDIKFNTPKGNLRLYTDDPVTVKYITPCSWSDSGESCCYITFGDNKSGYIQLSRLKK